LFGELGFGEMTEKKWRLPSAADIVAEVFLRWRTKIPGPLMRFTRGDVRGPYRFIQNRSRTYVAALNNAAEKFEDQLSRDFRVVRFSTFATISALFGHADIVAKVENRTTLKSRGS
jgi:hypothetical protein